MYIYCSTRGCTFSQDDFWSKRYNPFTQLCSDIAWLWKPKMITTEEDHFSWFWLARCVWWRFRSPFTQKWWTHTDWKNALKANSGKYPCCPKCKKNSLVTD